MVRRDKIRSSLAFLSLPPLTRESVPHRLPKANRHETAYAFSGVRTDAAEGAAMVNMFDRIRQGLCGLHGHNARVKFERDRMFLKCFSCGYESSGWTVSRASRVISSHPNDSPRTLSQPRLAGAHRIA
jgi:hypothetical protein